MPSFFVYAKHLNILTSTILYINEIRLKLARVLPIKMMEEFLNFIFLIGLIS
jgi:hypothetical protein